MSLIKLALVACLAVTAMPMVANAQTSEKLIGKWEAKLEVDVEKLKKLLADQGSPPEAIDMFLPLIEEQLGDAKIVMEFKDDGEMVFSATGVPGADETKKGTYEIIKEEGDKITVKGTDDQGEEETNTLEFDGNDKFTLTNEELAEAPIKPPVFTRVRD